MVIAFDAKRYFHNKTGLGNYSREIVHALALQFPEDKFILLDSENLSPLIPCDNLISWKPKNHGFLWRSLGMIKDINKISPHVFHGLSNELPIGIQKTKIRKVVTIHDVIFKRYPNYYNFTDRQIYDMKTSFAVKNADTIVATSAATAEDIIKYYKVNEKKISIVYQPVSASFMETKQSIPLVNGPYFLYVSTFNQRKNHGTLIQAFSRISKLTDYKLVLAGSSGNTFKSSKAFAASEKLQERIIFLENTSQENVVNLMQNASAFVYPSFFEGFGIPLAEAATCNLPLAVSDIPVFKELAGDAAIYFHPNKAEEIADAMLQLTSSDAIAKLSSNVSVILNKVDSKNIASQLMEIYTG